MRLSALLAFVLAVAVAGCGGGGGGAGSGEARPQAPDLSGVDPVTGEQVSLSAFAGKPIVVNIWASWCPGCNDEAADLRQFAETHPEAIVLGIDLQDTAENARAFYERWDWTHPSIDDPDGKLAAKLGLVGMPTTVFLDADHRIAGRIVGTTDLAGFERGLRRALAEP